MERGGKIISNMFAHLFKSEGCNKWTQRESMGGADGGGLCRTPILNLWLTFGFMEKKKRI